MKNRKSLPSNVRKKAQKFQDYITSELEAIGIVPWSTKRKDGHYMPGHITHRSRNWWIGKFKSPELQAKAEKHISKLKIKVQKPPEKSRFKGDGILIDLPQGLKNLITRSKDESKNKRKKKVRKPTEPVSDFVGLIEQIKELKIGARLLVKMATKLLNDVKKKRVAIPEGYVLVKDSGLLQSMLPHLQKQ